MKLYKCQMIDESMRDWEECVVAVMENPQEQAFYYQDKYFARKKLLINSGYAYEEYEVEFWFPYEMDGVFYAKEISEDIPQCVCDADYACFDYIEPKNTIDKTK